MPQLKGSIPWNKGKSGYTFSKNKRLHGLTLDFLKQDLVNGLSSSQIRTKWNLSEPTVYKYVAKLPTEYKQILTANGRKRIVEGHRTLEYRLKMKGQRKGWKNPNKGKTYLQIFGSEEKAKARVEKTRIFMKSDKNIRIYCKKISKPQRQLFEIVSKKYPQAVLEYPVKADKKTIWLDIAIPNLKINYEYDGSYWHNLNGGDNERDKVLKSLGWKVIRIDDSRDLNRVIV